MNHIKYKLLSILLIVSLTNCKKEESAGNNHSDNLYESAPMTIKHSYKYGSDISKHWDRTIELPVTGRFVQESHYVTNKDKFLAGRLFPISVTESIDEHLNRSLEIYLKFDKTMLFNTLYNNIWKRQWTPSEGGEMGQGSVGNIQATELTPENELWMMNMMWASGQLTAKSHTQTKNQT